MVCSREKDGKTAISNSSPFAQSLSLCVCVCFSLDPAVEVTSEQGDVLHGQLSANDEGTWANKHSDTYTQSHIYIWPESYLYAMHTNTLYLGL